MAPTPRNTTDRLKVHYHGPFGAHTMLFHKAAGALTPTFIGSVRELLAVMGALTWQGTTFDSAEYAVAGSNVFGAVDDWDPIVGGSGADPTTYDSPSTFIQFGGRAADTGIRAKLYLFEVREHPVHDMRYQLGDLARIDTVITELQSMGPVIGNVNGDGVVWYSYANVGENDYLTHRARRS